MYAFSLVHRTQCYYMLENCLNSRCYCLMEVTQYAVAMQWLCYKYFRSMRLAHWLFLFRNQRKYGPGSVKGLAKIYIRSRVDAQTRVQPIVRVLSSQECRIPNNVYLRIDVGAGMEGLRGYECKFRSTSDYSEILTTISVPALDSFS